MGISRSKRDGCVVGRKGIMYQKMVGAQIKICRCKGLGSSNQGYLNSPERSLIASEFHRVGSAAANYWLEK